MSIGELIKRYVAEFFEAGQWQQSKSYVLKRLWEGSLADVSAISLDTPRFM